jgi:phage terminase large subunit-like protein
MSNLPPSLSLPASLPAPELIAEEIKRRARNRWATYFPDEGPLRRELYSKHIQFFDAGALYRERCFMAGNRVGKTEGGSYETVCHLTGRYPDWWKGKRFNHPTRGWAAGDTGKTVREIIQMSLLGPWHDKGTGMIPGELLAHVTPKAGVPEAADVIYVKHALGGLSAVTLKSYDQRREAFQGTSLDFIWLDEECPLDIYTECLLRTMTTEGVLYLTFTPLAGLSEVVLSFMPGGDPEAANREGGTKYLVMCTWDEVPHLTEKAKAELWASIPEYQRAARSKGVPALGSGAIYPVAESDIVIPRMEIPAHWKRGYGLDVGWNRTACVWAAQNPDSGQVVLYDEHYMGKEEPAIHAAAIRGRGAWIPGVIDPAARGRSQIDGQQFLQKLLEQGLLVTPADNAVEAGIYQCWLLISGGMLKVCEHLANWRQEYRLYRRDEKGHVVKANDHLMDATRYLILSGRERMITEPAPPPSSRPPRVHGKHSWMA